MFWNYQCHTRKAVFEHKRITVGRKKTHLSKTRRKVAGSTYSNLPTLFLHIHHNGKFHWVTSVKLDRQIYMLDSMSNGKQRPSLQIQLAFLQGSDNILTTKYLPQIQQQTNSIDCGLFITIVNSQVLLQLLHVSA